MKIATIIFPVRGNSVFLANKKQRFGAGFLNGYGGRQEPTDLTIEDTAVRELQEESGIIAEKRDLEKVAIIDFFEVDNQIFECHVFFCRAWTGEFVETEEMAYPEAYPIDELPFDRMWHADRTWLPTVFLGKKIRARSYYDEGMKTQVRFEEEPLEEKV